MAAIIRIAIRTDTETTVPAAALLEWARKWVDFEMEALQQRADIEDDPVLGAVGRGNVVSVTVTP